MQLANVERVDGAQARLKPGKDLLSTQQSTGGKGGWGSGEIETRLFCIISLNNARGGKGGWGSGEIETAQSNPQRLLRLRVERVDGAQARLKHVFIPVSPSMYCSCGKGG